MTEPDDRLPATPGDHGHLRASDADRERAIDILQGAFARGRLTRGEFDTRVGQALGARTYGELTALTAGTGASRTGAPLVRTPSVAPARVPASTTARSCASVIMAALRCTGRCLAGSDICGEARTRVAGFPLDPSGRQRVLGYPARYPPR
jgi:Domain of unknown function (DUF1707)